MCISYIKLKLKNPRCDLNNKNFEFIYMGAVVAIELRAQNSKK